MKLIILYEGMDEWEYYEGTIEDAIAYVKRDKNYYNYGRTGAKIFLAEELYSVKLDAVESKSKFIND